MATMMFANCSKCGCKVYAIAKEKPKTVVCKECVPKRKAEHFFKEIEIAANTPWKRVQ